VAPRDVVDLFGPNRNLSAVRYWDNIIDRTGYLAVIIERCCPSGSHESEMHPRIERSDRRLTWIMRAVVHEYPDILAFRDLNGGIKKALPSLIVCKI
jgi:hypothetical protein